MSLSVRAVRGVTPLGTLSREAAIVLCGALAYFGLRALMNGHAEQAYAHAASLMQFERRLSLAWEPWLQQPLLGRPRLTMVANWVYIWGHWPVIVVVLGWLTLREPQTYRLVRNAMLVSGAIGLVVFATFPVAPPRLADPGLLDTVTLYSHAYRVLQPPAVTNQFAAFPSLHVGWDLVIGIAIARTATPARVRLVGWLLPVLMSLAVVATANHYVVDVFTGAGVAVVGLLVAQRLAPTPAAVT